jgi:antitoxin VapB
VALSIKSDEADRLARELAAETGESLTEAVILSLRERLERRRLQRGPALAQRVARLQQEVAALPVRDGRHPDAILGYDDHGLPS